ncbi:MAG TPA: A/G-specific adenine glycosylase [Methanomicrobia archaeon]|nr:A/G-specific adenine glycosylase [Methanomicrobia archaeon]
MARENDEWVRSFQRIIYAYYNEHKRPFRWRETHDPYAILVSEVMLQQTQTSRVRDKYDAFLTAFPTFESLAQAPTADVLELWQGLGYNKRALSLKRTAEIIMERHGGKLPSDESALRALPGIGAYTAAALRVFVFNAPAPVIDTNVRAVYIHFFSDGSTKVRDTDLLPLIRDTFDTDHTREWVYALMDYGAYLKRNMKNPARNSTAYKKQSRFEGSNRQVRGMIVRFLLDGKHSAREVAKGIDIDETMVKKALETLVKDGIITCRDDTYAIVS